MTKGKQILDLIANGASNDTIILLVDTTLNSVRWYRSKAKKAIKASPAIISMADWAIANNYDDQVHTLNFNADARHEAESAPMADDCNLSDKSKALFESFAKDAPNWSGEPLVDVTPAERGNLTDLKKKGYITTFRDNGNDFVQFTDAGKALATRLGYEMN